MDIELGVAVRFAADIRRINKRNVQFAPDADVPSRAGLSSETPSQMEASPEKYDNKLLAEIPDRVGGPLNFSTS